MEINNLQSSMISAYKKVSKTTSLSGKTESVQRVNTDKVEFDFSRSIAAARANAASSIDAEANTSRLEQLQKLYADENCPVSSEETAGAVIDND